MPRYMPTRESGSRAAVVAEASLVFGLATVVAFGAIYAIRAGPDDRPLALFAMFVFAAGPALVTAPIAAASPFSSIRQPLLLGAASTLSLLSPLMGLLLGPASVAIAALPVFAWAAWLIRMRAGASWLGGLRVLFAGGVLAAFIVILGPADRYLLPEEASLGLASADHLAHATLAQTILHHGVPSLGGSGLEFYHYHTLSHAVAAGLARATGEDILTVYTYWGTLALKLQLFWTIFVAAFAANTAGSLAERRAPIYLTYAGIVLFFVVTGDSESFLLGLAMFLGLLPLFCALLQRQAGLDREFGVGQSFGLAASFLCAAAKVPVGYFCGAILAWAALRQFPQRRVLMIATFVALALLAVVTKQFLIGDAYLPYQLLLASYEQYLTPLTAFSYLLPLTLLLLVGVRPILVGVRPSLSTTSVNGRRSLVLAWTPFRLGRDMLRRGLATLADADERIQILIVVTGACLLVLFTQPIGSNALYFSHVLLCVAGILLPQLVTQTCGIDFALFRPQALTIIAPAVLIVIAAAQFPSEIAAVVSRLFHRAWAADADPISPGKIVSTRRLIVESVLQDGMPLGGLRRKIAETDWAKLIRDIEAKDAAAPLAVYVTPENDAFWRRLEKDSPYWCMIPHLMIPAQTGIPQIASIAPLRIERICGWGDGILFYGYGREQDRHRSRNLTVEQLCAEAAGVKVSRVYRLASVAEIAKNTVIECAQK